MFDVPSDVAETLMTQWKGRDDESLEAPTELPELLQKDRPADRSSFGGRGGGGGGGWRKQFRGGSWNGQPRDFNRNGMLKRRASWNAGATQNSRKTFE